MLSTLIPVVQEPIGVADLLELGSYPVCRFLVFHLPSPFGVGSIAINGVIGCATSTVVIKIQISTECSASQTSAIGAIGIMDCVIIDPKR